MVVTCFPEGRRIAGRCAVWLCRITGSGSTAFNGARAWSPRYSGIATRGAACSWTGADANSGSVFAVGMMASFVLLSSANWACALIERELSKYSRSDFPLRPRDSEARVDQERAMRRTCPSDHPVSAQTFWSVSQTSPIFAALIVVVPSNPVADRLSDYRHSVSAALRPRLRNLFHCQGPQLP